MSLTLKNQINNFPIVAQGTYLGRLVKLIQIGTIQDSFGGELKIVNKIILRFEFPTEKAIFKPERGLQPFMVDKTYNFSMHEKSTLRKDLECMRGRAFTPSELDTFNLSNHLGEPCMINIQHKKSKSGKDYAFITAISGLPKGTECPPQINPSFEFTHEDFDEVKFNSLPSYLKEQIMQSREYIARSTQKNK